MGHITSNKIVFFWSQLSTKTLFFLTCKNFTVTTLFLVDNIPPDMCNFAGIKTLQQQANRQIGD